MNSHDRQPSISINSDAENEHFHLADSLISWMEYFKTTREDDPDVLSNILSELAFYVKKTKDDLELELTILQRCLRNLPWSSALLTVRDLENLAILSEHRGHNMSDLVSHIMLQVNLNDSLANQESKNASVVAKSVEHLSSIIVSQCDHLEGIELPINYLGNMNTNSIPKLASSMLARTEFLSNESDSLLFKLLKYICLGKHDLKTTLESAESHQKDVQLETTTITLTLDSIERAVIYARYVSDYLVDLIRRRPALVETINSRPLAVVVNNSLMDLEPILQSNGISVEQRKILYATLLKCCNCDALDGNSRLLLARLFAESNAMKNKPGVVVDMLQSIGQFLRDPKILVNMVEILVDLYFSITGHYEDVCKSFCISSIQVDLYLESCIREKSPMALMVYYESQLCRPASFDELLIDCPDEDSNRSTPTLNNVELSRDRNRYWPSYLFWLSRLIHRISGHPSGIPMVSVCANKLTTILIRLLVMFEADLEQLVLWDCPSESASINSSLSHLNHAGLTESMSEDNLSASEQKDDHDQCSIANNSTVMAAVAASAAAAAATTSQARPSMANLSSEHKCLLGFIKQLTSFYDSINPGGLKSGNKSELPVKISITSLTVACFLADRSLLYVVATPSEAPLHLEILRDELVKLRRVCLFKLEALRRSEGSSECSQFIDLFVESVQQNNKVQYREVVQLITTFELPHQSKI